MRLELRPYRHNEFEAACAIRELTSPERIERFRAAFEKSGSWVDHYLHLAIALEDQVVGDLQLRHCKQMMPSGVAHMGIEISDSQRGLGLGSQALSLIPDWAMKNGFHRIEGSTDQSNIAMRRTFEKANWNFEGILKSLFIEDGLAHDYYSYSWVK